MLVTPALLFATLCHLPQIGHQCHPNHKSFLIPIPSIPKPNRSYSSPILLSFTSKPATISSEKLEACHLLHPVGIHLKIIKSYNKQKKQYLGDHSKLINSPCTMKKGFMSALRSRALHTHTCVSLIHDPCARFCQVIHFDYTPIQYCS